MAINVNHSGDIGAMGQVALQGGQYAGQQQAIQNQLAMGNFALRQQQLAQQGQQFNQDMLFRRNTMLFQDYQQQRNFGQQAAVNRATQVRGIQGNLMSQQLANASRNAYQQRQFSYGASQDAVQFDQRKELLGLQNEQRNAERDYEFKQRREQSKFEDAQSRERYEWQLSYRQQKEQERYENAIHETMTNDDFSDEEKQFVVSQLEAKKNSIQPTPQAIKEDFPDGKGIGEVWDEGNYVLTRRQDGQVETLFENKVEPQPQIDPFDGSSYIQKDGKVVTITQSPFDGPSYNRSMVEYMKMLNSKTVDAGEGLQRSLSQEEYDKAMQSFDERWETQREAYVAKRQSVYQQQQDASIDANERKLNPVQGQPSMPTNAPNLPQADMEMVKEFAAQQLPVPSQAADEVGLPKPMTGAEYEVLENGTPYWNASTGTIFIKGQDGGFNLADPRQAAANNEAAKRIQKRNNPYMRFED